jgi:hypothetical protein
MDRTAKGADGPLYKHCQLRRQKALVGRLSRRTRLIPAVASAILSREYSQRAVLQITLCQRQMSAFSNFSTTYQSPRLSKWFHRFVLIDRPLENRTIRSVSFAAKSSLTDGGFVVKRKRFSVERITGILKQDELRAPIPELCRQHGVSEQAITAGTRSTAVWSHRRCGS